MFSFKEDDIKKNIFNSPVVVPTHTPIIFNPPKLNRIAIKKDAYFTISDRFKDLKYIGEGSYGMVCSAYDCVMNERVAIKKISGIFSNIVLQSRPELIPKRILREIHILRHFKHDNIIQLRYIEMPADPNKFDEIYIVMDLMETDLDKIIQSNQELNEQHIQFFMYQILHAVAYIHSAGILHRDIKPSNVLINLDGKIKLCDLGLAVKEHSGMNTVVVTRWYRAPELLLTNPKVYKVTQYSKPIDLWSCGCIMAELMARSPPFPGKDHFDQLDKIVQLLGYNKCVSAVKDIISSGRGVIGNDEEMLKRTQLEREGNVVASTPNTNPNILVLSNVALSNLTKEELRKHSGIHWRKIFPNFSENAVDLLDRLLQFDPANRISAMDALRHPFFKGLPQVIPKSNLELDFTYEERELTTRDYKRLIYREICKFHPVKIPNGVDTALNNSVHIKNDSNQQTNHNLSSPNFSKVSEIRTTTSEPYDDSSDEDYFEEDDMMEDDE